MEWVETTGSTLEAAKEAALDELGVDEQEAEFEILQEPKTGLFGRVRAEARIRARVRPTAPRAKEDRRDRRRSRTREDAAATDAAPASQTTTEQGPAPDRRGNDGEQSGARSRRRRPARAGAGARPAVDSGVPDAGERAIERNGGGAATGNRSGARSDATDRSSTAESEETSPDGPVTAAAGSRAARSPQARSNDRAGEPTVDVALAEQGRVAQQFLQGLVDKFGLQADITFAQPDEDTVDLAISGRDLGLLIGPRGATLLAIQDLTRTVVQRKTGASNGRIHVDVGGYREKRAVALANFARQVAAQVMESGTRRALEPMPSADRKIVHDALTDIEGVETISEGEDPHRRVVIIPAS